MWCARSSSPENASFSWRCGAGVTTSPGTEPATEGSWLTSRRCTASTSISAGADLFWALRGGGGNFGIVTSFEFRLHPVGPIVTAGAIFFPGEAAGDLLRFYRDWTEQVPDELTSVVNLATAPAVPFLPEEVHGKRVVIVSGCYAADPEDGVEAFRPLKSFGTSIADLIVLMPYAELQRFVDGQWGPGFHN